MGNSFLDSIQKFRWLSSRYYFTIFTIFCIDPRIFALTTPETYDTLFSQAEYLRSWSTDHSEIPITVQKIIHACISIFHNIIRRFLPMQDTVYASYMGATGNIPYNMTNDYMFHYILQKNEKVLRGLIASLLHLEPRQIWTSHSFRRLRNFMLQIC